MYLHTYLFIYVFDIKKEMLANQFHQLGPVFLIVTDKMMRVQQNNSSKRTACSF